MPFAPESTPLPAEDYDYWEETIGVTDDMLLHIVCFCIAFALCPWIWISLRCSANASAWDTPGSRCIRRVPHTISQSLAENLRGRAVWVAVLVVCILLLWIYLVLHSFSHAAEITFSYVCCWFIPSAVLAFTWVQMGQPNGVQVGLIANFFLQGGLMGIFFASFLNTMLRMCWSEFSPDCNPENIAMTPVCNTGAALMWVVVGLIEETFKSVWLFFRLRKRAEDLPDACCFCLPASRSYDCACWYKLAPTPYHVVLCALASAAGFEGLENFFYIFLGSGIFAEGDPTMPASTMLQVMRWIAGLGRKSAAFSAPQSAWTLMLHISVARLTTSGMHMIWTGLIGIGLAQRMFLPEPKQPKLYQVLLPSMVAHGLFNYSLTAAGAAAREDMQYFGAFFGAVFVSVIVSTCCLIVHLTGCCAPNFWDMFHPEPRLVQSELADMTPEPRIEPCPQQLQQPVA